MSAKDCLINFSFVCYIIASKKNLRIFFSENFRSDFLKKLIFTDPNIKMIADIDVAILKCLNFVIIEKKMKKKYAAYAFTCTKVQKSTKMRFFRSRVK